MKMRDSVPTNIAAAYLECSTRQIAYLRERRLIEGFRKGVLRGWRYYKDSLEKFKNSASDATLSE